MNSIIVTDRNRGCFGPLLDQQFRQRHKLFVRDLKWDIPSTDVIEADQYDRVDTVYVLVEEDGQLIGYARLLPTTSRVQYGQVRFSYMVRDAGLDRLPGIPSEILKEEAPSTPDVWEMTRVEAAGRKSLTAIFDAASAYLKSVGCESTITFTRQSFAPILNALGYETRQIGDSFVYGGKQYCVLATKVCKSDGGDKRRPLPAHRRAA